MVERRDVPGGFADLQIGDEPVEERYRNLMGTLAHAIDHLLNGDEVPKRNGFVLICFPFGEADEAAKGGQGRANYISNAKREDVVLMLREQLRRFTS